MRDPIGEKPPPSVLLVEGSSSGMAVARTRLLGGDRLHLRTVNNVDDAIGFLQSESVLALLVDTDLAPEEIGALATSLSSSWGPPPMVLVRSRDSADGPPADGADLSWDLTPLGGAPDSRARALLQLSADLGAARSKAQDLARRLEAVQGVVGLGTVLWDPRAGWAACDGAMARALGVEATDGGALLASWLDVVHPEDRESVRALAIPSAGPRDVAVVRLLPREGAPITSILTAWHPPSPGDGSVLLVHRDVTQTLPVPVRGPLDEAESDPVTGLRSRPALLAELDANLANPDPDVALLLLALARLEPITASLGREATDRLRSAVGARVTACIRPTDTIGRLGADELGVIVRGVAGPDSPVAVARRIHRAMDAPFRLDSRELRVGVSVGAAVATGSTLETVELLRRADAALSVARTGPPPRTAVFGPDVQARALELEALEQDLRRAVGGGALRLAFQPIFAFPDQTLCGFEALVRWVHPVRGELLPGSFLPMAEASGLVVPMGRWVIEHAIDQAMRWRLRHPDTLFRVSVNVSARELESGNLAQTIDELLARSGAPADVLGLEITEAAALEACGRARGALARCRELGLHIGLDDFGAGYAGTDSLRRLPLDSLKIDPSVIAQLPADPDSARTVASLVALAHDLSLDVVAKGVETTEQLDAVRLMGVDELQGYLLAPPGSAAAADRWLPAA